MQHARNHQRHHLPLDQISHDASFLSDSELEDVHECQLVDTDEVRRYSSIPYQYSENRTHSADENSDLSESESELALHSDESPDDTALHESENEDVQTEDHAEDTDVEAEAHTTPSSPVRNTPTTRKSQRERKPTIRLTYDQPGRSTEEPVTIVHKGMVIQLNLSPQERDVSTAGKKPKTSKKLSIKTRTHPSNLGQMS
ncbi:paraneoplastic antigen Ma2-like [Scomber scombrus]|uniref:Paraneoplastic antigen Ma2-like n=1 Tax=Scomber scombrus TaxID=13677 RepID=A0AAV1NN37_SCOSC